MRGTIGFLHREGKRKSSSLPCEEQVESVLSLLNPHLCIPPFHRVLLPLLCTPYLHFPYNYNSNYTHTLNHFLPDLQQVAESELSPAAGSARAIAITKEEGVTKRSLRKSPPIALVRPCVVLSSLLVYCANEISTSLWPKVINMLGRHLSHQIVLFK